MLDNIHNKKHRKIVETRLISNYKTINERSIFFKLSPYLIKLVLNK